MYFFLDIIGNNLKMVGWLVGNDDDAMTKKECSSEENEERR